MARNEKTQGENEKRQKYVRHVEIVSTFHQGRKQTKKKSLHKQRKKNVQKNRKILQKIQNMYHTKKFVPPTPEKPERKKTLKIIRHKNRNNEEKTEKINNGRILLQIEIFFGKQKQKNQPITTRWNLRRKNFLMKKKIRKKGEEKNSKMNEATVSI